MAVEKKKNAPPFPAVLLVSQWALLTASILHGSFASATVLVHYHVPVPSWWLGEGTKLTAAAAAEMSANLHGAWWCSAAEAAAAALALLLPDRRRRRALACVALAATAATHLIMARTLTLSLAADSRFWWMWLAGVVVNMSFWAAGDTVCFLALLGRLDDFSFSY